MCAPFYKDVTVCDGNAVSVSNQFCAIDYNVMISIVHDVVDRESNFTVIFQQLCKCFIGKQAVIIYRKLIYGYSVDGRQALLRCCALSAPDKNKHEQGDNDL